MNLRDLQYLSAIAEHEHMGRAAIACHVSQPTMSMQIKKLEEELGVQLLERANKRVRLSAHGKIIAARATDIFHQSNALKELAKSLRDPLAGECRLGAFPTLAPYYLPHIVPLITSALPKTQLLLVEDKTDRLLDNLKSGTLDMALIALPIEEKNLSSHALFTEPFYLAVANSHRLAGRIFVTAKEVKNERMLLLEDGHCMRDQALDVCRIVGAHELSNFRATSLETLRQMVAANVGVTLIPKCAITQNAPICMLPFKGNPYRRTIGLVWRDSYPKMAMVEAIRNILSKHSLSCIA